jgi:hypothetical protein
MSLRAVHKHVFKPTYTNHSAFTPVSAMHKHPRIHQDPPLSLSMHPAPTWPLFSFTHSLRESLPAEVSEPQGITVLPETCGQEQSPDPHISNDEEAPVHTPASRKVIFPPSRQMLAESHMQGQNEMMTDWLNSSAQSYLLNMLRSESTSEQGQTCMQCEMPSDPIFQCRDCLHQWG